MLVLALINSFLRWAITAMVVAGILLIILRSIFDYTDVNPFTWHARNVRRATDPVLAPARAMLRGLRLDPTAAPFIVVVLMIVVAGFFFQIFGEFFFTIPGGFFCLCSPPAVTPPRIISW